MNFELILNEKYEMELLEWAKPTWPQPSRPSPQRLLARDETGEPPPPNSPLTRGSPAESGRPVASGRGRRCQGASPGGEGPDLGHRQRRGSPWRSRGSEVGRWWGTGDGKPEKRWRAPTRSSQSGGELRWRSLW
jgi:hypothetical protein